MSHPHDGSIGDRSRLRGSGGYFANSGDESNSVMSYIDLNADFGQFDRDNMARYLTVGYTIRPTRSGEHFATLARATPPLR